MADPVFMNSKVKIDFSDPNTYHDRVLVVGNEKKKFHVNSGILSQWSEFFRGMFDGNFKEANSKEILIEEVDPEQLKHFLHLLYKNSSTELDVEFLVPMIDLSHRFLAPNVLEICKEYINKHFDEIKDLMVPLLKVACKHNIDDLKNQTMDYFMLDEFTSLRAMESLPFIELLNCAIDNKLETFKEYLFGYICQYYIICETAIVWLNYAITRDVELLKTGIINKMATWTRNSINGNCVIDLLICAFENDIGELKKTLRERIFYSTIITDYLSDKKVYPRRSRYGTRVMVNGFLQANHQEILGLDKEIKDFIIMSTISPE